MVASYLEAYTGHNIGFWTAEVRVYKQPAGPETVLVKPNVFIKLSVALWRNDELGSA